MSKEVISVTDHYGEEFLIIEPQEYIRYEYAPVYVNNNYRFGCIINGEFKPSSRYNYYQFTINYTE